MSLPLSKTPNILQRAKSESMTDKDYSTYKRVERRFSTAAIARLQSKLGNYKLSGKQMSYADLLKEKHSSRLLGIYLRADGVARPAAKWEAHHIVSGNHPEAFLARTILTDELIKLRIDDPDNGAWMPKTKADARPTIYPNAIGHNRIHRDRYYHWIYNTLAVMTTEGQVRAFLNTVRAQLLHGNIKPEMKLQQEIDDAEYASWLKKNRAI